MMVRPVTMQALLTPVSVALGVEASGKKQVLQDLAARVAAAWKLEAHDVFDVLWEREKLGTTGVGHGIAIPHGRISGLQEVRGFFARLDQPVDFESVDSRPVDLVFLLLSPMEAGADHLHALATVSRLLRDAALCERLRKARDSGSLYSLITTAIGIKAA